MEIEKKYCEERFCPNDGKNAQIVEKTGENNSRNANMLN